MLLYLRYRFDTAFLKRDCHVDCEVFVVGVEGGEDYGGAVGVIVVPMEPTLIEWEHTVGKACGEYAHSRSGNYVVEPVTAVVHAQESDHSCEGVGSGAPAGSVFLAHEFRAGEHSGCVAGWEGVAGRCVGALFADGIFCRVDYRGHNHIGRSSYDSSFLERMFGMSATHAEICDGRKQLGVIVKAENFLTAQFVEMVFDCMFCLVQRPSLDDSESPDGNHCSGYDEL